MHPRPVPALRLKFARADYPENWLIDARLRSSKAVCTEAAAKQRVNLKIVGSSTIAPHILR